MSPLFISPPWASRCPLFPLSVTGKQQQQNKQKRTHKIIHFYTNGCGPIPVNPFLLPVNLPQDFLLQLHIFIQCIKTSFYYLRYCLRQHSRVYLLHHYDSIILDNVLLVYKAWYECRRASWRCEKQQENLFGVYSFKVSFILKEVF